MKISYAITVCNELEEIKRLLDLLIENKREQDEIVVLLDNSKSSKQLETLLEGYSHKYAITFTSDCFNNHFADWKNKLTSHCNGDYIFQIDADEYPHPYFIENLPAILEHNSAVELYVVPRVNTVEGLTQEHIKMWRWNVDELERVNWPDYQTRIFKNNSDIKWKNKVHEQLGGFKNYTLFMISYIDQR